MRKKPRFHSLKKLVSLNVPWVGERLWDANRLLESQTRLVTLVAIQSVPTQAAKHHFENVFPAEMDRKVGHTCLSRRADTREEMEAPIQEKPARRRAYGLQILG